MVVKGKKIFQFDLEGNFINKFPNIEKASSDLKIRESSIRGSISQESCFGHRYYFSYYRNFIIPIKKCSFNPLTQKDRNRYVPKIKSRGNPIYQFDFNGKLLQKYYSIADTSIKLGIKNSTISAAVINKNKCKDKYYFSKNDTIILEEYDKVNSDKIKKIVSYSIYKFDIKGNFIKEYGHIKYASLENKISRSSINTAIKNRILINNEYYFGRDKILEVKLNK